MPAVAVTVTATFVDAPSGTYTLTVIDGTGGDSYAPGKAVTVTAVIPAGKVFDAWTGDTGYLASAAASVTIVTMPSANIAIAATFKDAPVGTYTLTVVNGIGGGSYDPGTATVIAAVVPAGKAFAQWVGDIGYLANPLLSGTTVTMPSANITVSATYKVAVPCVITLVSNPADAGILTVSPTQIYVGDTVSLTATPTATTYVFVRWEATELATLARPYTAASSALINGDATLTAFFAVKSPIQKAELKLDNSRPNRNAATVTKSMLPMTGGAPFTFDIKTDTLVTLIDGVDYVMDTETGVFKQQGTKKIYTFTSKPWMAVRTKVTLNLEKGFWSLSVSKGNKLSDTLDSSDGVGLFLVVVKKNDAPGVFRAYGESLAMGETTSWQYAAWVNGWTPSDSGMTVSRATGKFLSDKAKGNKDQFKSNGTFSPGTGFAFDPAHDTVSISIDGIWTQKFTTFDSSALTKKNLIKSTAISVSDKSKSEIVVDLGKRNWSFKMNGGNLAGVSGFDGITMKLDVGTYTGSAFIKPTQKSALKYPVKK